MISQQGVSPDQRKLQVPTDMPPQKMKKELQLFLGILNYISKFSPATAEVCEALHKVKSVKTDLTWNRMSLDLNKAKAILIHKVL